MYPSAVVRLEFPLTSPCVSSTDTFSQSVTQSPNAVTGKECESVTITCLFKEGFSGSYEFNVGHFFKQAQSGAEWQRITTGGRFVVSTSKAENTFTLKILGLRVEDMATYYCQAEYKWRIHSDGPADGTGTTVTVTADSISQSPPQQSSLSGDTATLNCVYSGFCSYTVHWYRLFPGQALEFLLRRHTSGKQDKEEAAEGRISGSLDPGQKISLLTLSEVLPSDEAVYYCGMSPRIAQWHSAVR
ncbi:immunoglobulin gamma-1 heavy chain-like [Amblyraja radiata]|uniref:immunoglobulin gamma-1 heavy chain-like n=1 Tax=Amblyraja radiata TaxID=386614 RepID=UPI00140297CF|nr:immunoglobulin gamma-1 heavy chain-like [Amblyraja radiata]